MCVSLDDLGPCQLLLLLMVSRGGIVVLEAFPPNDGWSVGVSWAANQC